MIKRIGLFAILILLTVLSCIALKKSLHKNSDAIAKDISSLNTYYHHPEGYTYTEYVKKTTFDHATYLQQKYIANHALVVNDNDIIEVARIKELKLNDVQVTTINSFTNNPRVDTLSSLSVSDTNFSGYVDLSADEILFFPIHYDDKWRVIVDITELKPFRVNDERMGIFLEKGRHHINVVYKFDLRDQVKFYGSIFGLIVVLISSIILNRRKILQLERSENIPVPDKIGVLVVTFIAILVVIYFYFLKWKTCTAYGDDLFGFQMYFRAHNSSELLKSQLLGQKYRPLYWIVFDALISSFHTHLSLYYFFNVFIISVNTFIFARILNLFLNSYIFSFLFSLTFGLSRFFYYTINQLLTGGALEGLALTFFLCFLFLIVSAAIQTDSPQQKKHKKILLAILFANLSMYTHERYIVLFAIVPVIFFLLDGFRNLSARQKMFSVAAIIVSILANIVIKTQVYNMPFFVGTGGTNIQFSFSTAIAYLKEAVLSICLINEGPGYLVGIDFESLPFFDTILVLFFIGACILTLLYGVFFAIFKYFAPKFIEPHALKKVKNIPHLPLLFFLFLLFMLCLAPAIVTIRLEQRWLTASLSIFIIMCVIVLTNINYKSTKIRYIVFLSFILCYSWVNFSYFSRGVSGIYMYTAEATAYQVKEAITRNIILPQTTKLYFFEKHRAPNSENELTWAIGDGYMFELYGGKKKQLVYVDSMYTKKDTSYVTSFPGFNPDSAQIIYLGAELQDITGEFIKDSLKTFLGKQ